MNARIISRSPSAVWVDPVAIEHRIDPNPFRPEYLDSDAKLDNFGKTVRLGDLLANEKDGLASGATPLGANYISSGVRFIRTGEVNDCWINAGMCVYITTDADEETKRSRLAAGDVLLTITGACFGKSAVVPQELLPANISQHSVRIRTNKSADRYFLVAYLNSSVGQLQICKQTVGSTRQAIDFVGIRLIRIPLPDHRIQQYVGAKVTSGISCCWAVERLRSENC